MIPIETKEEEGRFSFVGGYLCLDFSNTMSEYRPTPINDKFAAYSDLVDWSREAGLLTKDEAQRLVNSAERRQDETVSVLEEARLLRNSIHYIFSDLAAESDPNEEDLVTLNAALSKAMYHSQVVRLKEGNSFSWGWAYSGNELDRMLWPVARSAAELLSSPDLLSRVNECGGETCGWLFLDMSRNHSRHWCDMRDCGNRAKARRHYQRKRTT